MKKFVKLPFHVVTVKISLGIVALFVKIYDGEPILTVFSNNGEDAQYRCFK